MPRQSNRGRNSRNDRGVMEMARERPIAAAAAAAGAAAAGLFLWSKRNQISQQISNLSEQIGEWTESMGGDSTPIDDTAGLTTAKAGTRSGAGSRSASAKRGRSGTGSRTRGMSETGGGNATPTSGSPRGRGRAGNNS